LRLSEYVYKNGIDKFNADDFHFVGSKLATKPDRLILVGGQAIETWGHFFGVLPPSGEHEPLTEDADFYGGKEDAKWLCSLLGKRTTELILAKDFDPSPNTATVYIERPDGRILLIDFLRSVIGLSAEQIKTLAVRVNVGGILLSVMHPLLCLESRLANLATLPSKRNTNGIMQAQWVVQIIEAYLRRRRADGADKGEMIKACHYIAEAAEYRSGPYCFDQFGIDPLLAVSPTVLDSIGGRFVSDDWPRRTERIVKRRNERQETRDRKLLSFTVTLASSSPQPGLDDGNRRMP
jgi:hypothetical protein